MDLPTTCVGCCRPAAHARAGVCGTGHNPRRLAVHRDPGGWRHRDRRPVRCDGMVAHGRRSPERATHRNTRHGRGRRRTLDHHWCHGRRFEAGRGYGSPREPVTRRAPGGRHPPAVVLGWGGRRWVHRLRREHLRRSGDRVSPSTHSSASTYAAPGAAPSTHSSASTYAAPGTASDGLIGCSPQPPAPR